MLALRRDFGSAHRRGFSKGSSQVLEDEQNVSRQAKTDIAALAKALKT